MWVIVLEELLLGILGIFIIVELDKSIVDSVENMMVKLNVRFFFELLKCFKDVLGKFLFFFLC